VKSPGIVAVGLALAVALASCTRTVERIVVVTPTPAGTPTLTAEELAYLEAVATVEREATVQARVEARETASAKPTNTPRPTLTPRPPPYKLALISASCTTHSDIGYSECEGFVKNISSQTLEDIQVVVEWVDAGGVPRSSDDALIDYNPLLPGQESPWSTVGDYNPALTRFRVRFTEFFGGTILTRDDRQ
jgi:hypothetical protein